MDVERNLVLHHNGNPFFKLPIIHMSIHNVTGSECPVLSADNYGPSMLNADLEGKEKIALLFFEEVLWKEALLCRYLWQKKTQHVLGEEIWVVKVR